MYRLLDLWQATLTQRAGIDEIAPLCKRYGIGGINASDYLFADENKAMQATRHLSENGLQWGLMYTPMDTLAEDVDDAAFEAGLETLKHRAAIAEKMGVRRCYNHVWNGSHTRAYAAQYEWAIGRLRRVWKVLDDHGIRYGLEFLGPDTLRNSFKYPFFNTLSGILAMAADVAPSCGFVFDTFHWYCGGSANMGDLYLATKNVDKLINVHVNDGLPGRTREQQQDMERAMPMTNGVIDAAVVCRAFHDCGYDGPVMCEPMSLWQASVQDLPADQVIAAWADAYAPLGVV